MIGTQIKKLRKARSISQVELANQIGVSKQAVSNWENNNILPSIDILIKLSKFFACSSDYLLELDNPKTSIDTSKLSPEEAQHILQVVRDLEKKK